MQDVDEVGFLFCLIQAVGPQQNCGVMASVHIHGMQTIGYMGLVFLLSLNAPF
jgi:hypothetical protein